MKLICNIIRPINALTTKCGIVTLAKTSNLSKAVGNLRNVQEMPFYYNHCGRMQFSTLCNESPVANTKQGNISAAREIINIPPHKEIKELLIFYSRNIDNIFRENLVGVYLSGSLSYGGFNPHKSDIDIITVSKKACNSEELELAKLLHRSIEKDYPEWAEKFECSYIPTNILKSTTPPKEPRPYYNNMTFYEKAHYGNEWLINNHLLYKYGIPLIGPEFSTLTDRINITEVKKACIKDLFEEWIPKIEDLKCLDDSHYQSYMVLNLCRILYSIMQNPTGSKAVAASWVKSEFGTQWRDLIETAEQWQYGKEMALQVEIKSFTRFVAKKTLETRLYRLLSEETNHTVIASS